MRGKESRVKLSPNEEEQLLREELDRRRKLRLQQVREQERFIAAQVRRQVQERRRQQLQTLADSLQQHWQQQHTHRLQALHTHYHQSLSAVGEGHRSATHNEPDEQCVSQKRVERQERAEERHREALRELNTRRHEEQQQPRRLMEARRRALLEEKRRAQRVCSLPPPPPDPLQGVVLKTPRPLRSTAAELVSITHTAVDRETDAQPQSAQQAAALESERLEDLQREQDGEQQQRLQRARERGEHALRREQHTQDRARLLCDLQRLQHADLQRRSQAVRSVPAQVFQPLYRQQELRDQQQRDLEIAFQDLYTHQRKVKGDWLLQLVPEPLPPPSAASHDEELDVTLDPCETPPTESPESSADPGRQALSTLLERIRSRREPRTGVEEESAGVEEESAGVEEESAGVESTDVEEETTTDDPHCSDDAVVAGHLLPADHTHTQVEETAERPSRTHTHIQEAVLRQQEEQLALLEELEEQRRELQQQLSHTLHTLQEPEHQQEEISSTHPEPPAQIDSDDTHRLHQYQQRLLQQNRLHRQFIAEAQRRLQEHQQTLRTHTSMSSTETPQKKRMCVSLQLREQSLSASVHTPAGGSASAHTAGGSASAHTPAGGSASAHTPAGGPASAHTVLSGGSPQDTHTEEEHTAPEPNTLPLSLPLPTFPTSLPPPCPLPPSLLLPPPHAHSLPASLPLPPPAVVLELLRSRHHHHTPLQSAEVTGSGSASSSGPGSVHLMRRQRDALQALISAHTQAPVSSSADQLNTLLSLITESDEQRDTHTLSDGAPAAHTYTAPDGVCAPAPAHRGRVRPPVSRPPVRLAFLQQMEQHELSAIQEVDSPANLSLDTGVQESVSSSVSLPVCLVSEEEFSQSEGSQLTGRVSRMSWRHTLMQESRSASQSSVKQQQQLLDPGCLSSTTISTGSFSTSEHESCSFNTAGSVSRDAVQQIIEKYSEELSASLTHTSAVSSSWSSVLQEESLHDGDTHTSGVFQPLQPHPDIDSSSSSSRSAVRDEQSSRAQGWSQMVSSVLERLSEQLSVTHTHSEHTLCAAAAASGVALQTPPSSSDAGVCSSQVCVQSDAGTEEEEKHTVSFASPELNSDQHSSALTDTAHDDPSAVFLPLATEITLNQSADLSTAPLDAELGVSDWLQSADQSHHALQQMRSEPHAEPELRTSADPLSITHESLCEATDTNMSTLQEEDPPAQEVKESTLTELLERAQAAGELKGILEESVLSFISLPESESSAVAQDEELSHAEEQHSSQSEPAFPHAVMLLEAQCSPAQRQRRDRLAQRSVLRAAQIKHTHTHRRNTTCHNPSTTHTRPASASADGLKSVCEVRICTEEHRRRQEAEMLQRTHRLYSQLEEVKQRKQMQIRQQSYTNNRERARDFHRKTLENLRARPKS